MKTKKCAFTGHRPKGLGYPESDERCDALKRLLRLLVRRLIQEQSVTHFISGMAQGVDQYAAEIVLERKKRNNELHLICALPHPNFESRRSMTEKMRFNKIIKNADLVKEINDHYFTGCYQVRNEWMVDKSNLVIAVFNGQKSGTKNTVDYAKRKDIRVVNVLGGI